MRAGSFARAGAVAFLCLVAAASAPAQTAKLPEVVVALPAFSLSFSAEYLAEDMGLYRKRGIAVKMIELPGVGTINGVISGSADFGLPGANSLTRAAARGQRLLAIAETTDHLIAQVVLRKDLAKDFDPAASFAKHGELLRGRTIAVDGINSLIHAYVRLLAIRANYSPEEIHIAVMQPPNMIAAFAAKQIDGFAMSPPWPEKPVLEGTAVMIASGPDGDPSDLLPFANNVVVTRPETCEKRKLYCDAVGHAFAEAVAFMQDHPDEALALVQKRFPNLDDKLLAASFAVIRKITPSPPIVSKAGIENAELFNVQSGLMKAEEKLKSYDGLFTDQFVR
jgi:NitT/TauT family transport system substrate-binding protein